MTNKKKITPLELVKELECQKTYDIMMATLSGDTTQGVPIEKMKADAIYTMRTYTWDSIQLISKIQMRFQGFLEDGIKYCLNYQYSDVTNIYTPCSHADKRSWEDLDSYKEKFDYAKSMERIEVMHQLRLCESAFNFLKNVNQDNKVAALGLFKGTQDTTCAVSEIKNVNPDFCAADFSSTSTMFDHFIGMTSDLHDEL